MEFESLYLQRLPSSSRYEQSYMHRDYVTHLAVAKEFIITTSQDGYLKFWKQTDKFEFIKTFRAHSMAITCLAVSGDELSLASTSVDKSLKVFNVQSFDMIDILKFDSAVETCCWIKDKVDLLAVCLRDSSEIKIFKEKELIDTVKVHSSPVFFIRFNPLNSSCVSVDSSNQIEYWNIKTHSLPELKFEFKSETDLYSILKCGRIHSLEFSPDYKLFAVKSGDKHIRIFRYSTGKLYREYDESKYIKPEEMEQSEFDQRVIVDSQVHGGNLVWDDSGNYLLFGSFLGIKVLNIKTNKVQRVLGKSESLRFTNIALYQGIPQRKNLVTAEMAASDNPAFKDINKVNPMLIATAFQKQRFYLITSNDPNPDMERDIVNEMPLADERLKKKTKGMFGRLAIVHTEVGDISLELYPEKAPKAVENFVTHSKQGYYNNNIFHRVIKGFMIQTGDPLGDGTGGESIWGHQFEDEFSDLKHKKYSLSMANAGKNKNGSQFFITVVDAPWLDGKHTIFGKCVSGFDVVHRIERTQTDKHDHPIKEIKILSIDIKE